MATWEKAGFHKVKQKRNGCHALEKLRCFCHTEKNRVNFSEYLGADQCWTEGRSSTAVAEDFRPTATATMAEVLGHSYGRRFLLVVFLGSSKMEAEMCFSLHRCHLRL